MFNKVILTGNLTRDIELRYTQGGTAIGKTGIAVTRKYSSNGEKKEETVFVDITFFGKSAEIANQYTRKGSKVLIEGRLTLDQWEQDGQKRSKHSVTVENMQMLDSRQDSQQQDDYRGHTGSNQANPTYTPQQSQQHTPPPSQMEFDGEMPF